MSDPITNYALEQRKYVPEQYKRSTKLLGVIDAALESSDDLERALREISDSFNIEDAVGPMLDYFGLYFGIVRKIGETDEQLRLRVRLGSGTEDLPTPEAIYNYFKIAIGIVDMILCPVWPAGMYFVIDGLYEIDSVATEQVSMTSGASLVRGAFLSCEDEGLGYLLLEDTGTPLVIDYHPTEFDIVTSDGDDLVTSDGDDLYVIDTDIVDEE